MEKNLILKKIKKIETSDHALGPYGKIRELTTLFFRENVTDKREVGLIIMAIELIATNELAAMQDDNK
jgi:hypothetical protein